MLGGDRGDSKGPGGVPPPGFQADHEDDGYMWGGRGLGIPPGGGSTGSRRTAPHNGVH